MHAARIFWSVVALAIGLHASPAQEVGAQIPQDLPALLATKWGESPQRVEASVGGVLSKGVTGEDIVRAECMLLGLHSAEVIYFFGPKYGLSRIVFLVRERSAAGGDGKWSHLLHDDYAKSAARHLVASVTKAAGKPILAEESDAGCDYRWRTDHVFVTVSSVAVLMGRYMRMEVQGLNGEVTQDGIDHEGDFHRVDPKSWGENAAMDVMWLMGPGDVKAIYSDLRHFSLSKADPLQCYSARRDLEGDAVIYFEFYKAQLVRMRIQLYEALPRQQPIDWAQMKKDGEAFGARCDQWGLVVRSILNAKYGQPIAAPDAALEEKVIVGDVASGGKHIVWHWAGGKTAIIFERRSRGFQQLEYRYQGPEWAFAEEEHRKYVLSRYETRLKPF